MPEQVIDVSVLVRSIQRFRLTLEVFNEAEERMVLFTADMTADELREHYNGETRHAVGDIGLEVTRKLLTEVIKSCEAP